MATAGVLAQRERLITDAREHLMVEYHTAHAAYEAALQSAYATLPNEGRDAAIQQARHMKPNFPDIDDITEAADKLFAWVNKD